MLILKHKLQLIMVQKRILKIVILKKFGLSLRFENCLLNHASFFQIELKNTVFTKCQLQETDFTESNVTGSLFDECDLYRAMFNQSILEKADFRTSRNYSIDPENNRIKKAKFSYPEILGLLDKYDIETDDTGVF